MRRRVRTDALPLSPAAALPLLAAALLLAALTLSIRPAAAKDLCDDSRSSSRMNFGNDRGKTVRDIQEMHEAAPHGTWHIDAGDNGAVQVTEWDKNEIMICAQITAWAKNQEQAERLLRSVHVENANGRLSADGPDQSNSARWGVSFRIYAPRTMDLDVQAVNGPVSVKGIAGHMTLHTENGPLEIVGAGGDIEGRTTNGPLSVTLTGSRWKGRGLDVETSNGPVQLSIPDGYSAELTTGTENGPMAGAFVGSNRGHRHRHVTMTLGSGGSPIRVVTTNGPIVVNQGDDDHSHGDADQDDDSDNDNDNDE